MFETNWDWQFCCRLSAIKVALPTASDSLRLAWGPKTYFAKVTTRVKSNFDQTASCFRQQWQEQCLVTLFNFELKLSVRHCLSLNWSYLFLIIIIIILSSYCHHIANIIILSSYCHNIANIIILPSCKVTLPKCPTQCRVLDIV